MSDRFRLNNFDLIRLIAALQVAIGHGSSHLQVGTGLLGKLLSLVPGVPIFFFVSGFLISRSYENNSRISEYATNRLLRIYPALIVCTVLSIGSAFAVAYLPVAGVGLGKSVLWFLSQVTVVQFYNPEFMRGFGTGVLNGSLWTISVELQFYVLLPALYSLVSRLAKTRFQWNVILLAVTMIFLVANVALRGMSGGSDGWLESAVARLTHAAGYGTRANLAAKFLSCTFVPWIYMFLVGVIAQRNFEAVSQVLAGKAALLVPFYLSAAYIGKHYSGAGGDDLNPVTYLLLAATVFSCAYTLPWLAERLLKRTDISYGVYIYHIPVVNVLLFYGLSFKPRFLVMVVSGAIVAGILSWFVVERPAMKMKKHPLMPVQRTV